MYVVQMYQNHRARKSKIQNVCDQKFIHLKIFTTVNMISLMGMSILYRSIVN